MNWFKVVPVDIHLLDFSPQTIAHEALHSLDSSGKDG